MSLTFKTDSILDTLFDISIGNKDGEIRKHTKYKISNFTDLGQPGRVTICFDANLAKRPRDKSGRFKRERI